jgi:hypothetical protein
MLEFHLLHELLFVCRRISVNTISYLDPRRIFRKSQASKVRLTSSESLAEQVSFPSHFQCQTVKHEPSQLSHHDTLGFPRRNPSGHTRPSRRARSSTSTSSKHKFFCVRIINSISLGMQPRSPSDRLFIGAAVFDRPRILQCDSDALNAWLGPLHPGTPQVASTKRICVAES